MKIKSGLLAFILTIASVYGCLGDCVTLDNGLTAPYIPEYTVGKVDLSSIDKIEAAIDENECFYYITMSNYGGSGDALEKVKSASVLKHLTTDDNISYMAYQKVDDGFKFVLSNYTNGKLSAPSFSTRERRYEFGVTNETNKELWKCFSDCEGYECYYTTAEMSESELKIAHMTEDIIKEVASLVVAGSGMDENNMAGIQRATVQNYMGSGAEASVMVNTNGNLLEMSERIRYGDAHANVWVYIIINPVIDFPNEK